MSRQRRALIILAAWFATPDASGVVAQAAAEPTPKVLLIGIDGVRSDVLAEVPTPHLDALATAGAWSVRARTTIPTVSGPSWSSMLTGVWPEKHGVRSNNFAGNRYSDFPDFLTRIESARPELETFVAADWLPLVTDDSGGPLIGSAPDRVVVHDGYELGWAAADRAGVDAAVAAIAEGDPDAMFVYLGDPDETSHQTGAIGPEYRASIEEADRQVGRLVAAVRARPTHGAEDWLILVSTDHGRRPDGGHGGRSEAELTTFFIASGPAAVRGEIAATPRIVDIAATALTHLGLRIDPAWGLDGRAAGLRNAPSGWMAGATPLELTASDGVTVHGERHGDLLNARALVLLFHQGGSNARGEYAPIIPRLLRNGYTAIAIDARSGGPLLGSENRTRSGAGGDPHYCEAYPDLEAALDHGRAIAGDLPIVVWGSSYSGALALELAGERPEDIRGVLAFSPAGGEPMGDCPADRFAEDVRVPAFVLRPASEAELEPVADQLARFEELGFRTHVADPGRHGSSMLVRERVEGDVEATWSAVLDFLAEVSRPR